MNAHGGVDVRASGGRSLFRLIGAMALVNLGDSLSLILLPLLVIQRFGFGPELGVTLAARLVPVVLGGGVAMWVLSRFPARIVSSMAIAGLASMTALLPVTNDLVQLNAVSMMAGIASSMAGPALLAMRSSVVPRGQVVRANSLVVAAERLPQVIGPLAAAVALTVVDVGTLFVAKAALTLLAAALVIGLRAPAPAAPVKLLSAENLRTWRELLRNRRLAGYLVTGAAYAIAAGVARMVLIAISATSFPDAPYMLALLLGALAVGSVVGALLGSLVPVHWSGRLYVIGTVGEAGAVMSAASSDQAILLVGLLVVAGSLEALATIAFFSDVQVLLDERQNGVLFAGFLPIADAGAILGTLTGPGVIAAGGVLLGAGLAAALAVVPLLPFLGWFLRASRSP